MSSSIWRLDNLAEGERADGDRRRLGEWEAVTIKAPSGSSHTDTETVRLEDDRCCLETVLERGFGWSEERAPSRSSSEL